MADRSACFLPLPAQRDDNIFMRSWTVFSCRSEAAQLNWMSRRKTTPYIIKTMSSEANRLPLLVCFSLVGSFCVVSSFPVQGRGGCASGRLKVRCCWKGSEVKLLLDPPPLVATAPPICNPRKGVVCIRLFKVVPTASASLRPKVWRHI